MSSKYIHGLSTLFVFCVFIITTEFGSAATLFSDDFEIDRITTADPSNTWDWQRPYDSISNPNGMMFGEGDIYTRSLAIKHSGNYSLRLNFKGRNNFCNVCISGTKTLTMKAGISDSSFFQDDSGTDLTLNFGALPDPQSRVYNKTDNWARWQVSSVTGDKLNFVGNSPIQNDMGGDGDFDAGDEIKLVKMCGNPEKRSDCNLGINLLQNVNGTEFPLGGTLARRMYVYIPSETTTPDTTLKLGYTYFKKGSTKPYETHFGVNGKLKVLDNHLNLHGGPFHWLITIETDKWYYFEDVWHRESTVGSQDGVYELYIHAVDNPTASPVLTEAGLEYGDINAISIIGNWQKQVDALGSVYIDDVMISTSKIGPTSSDIVPISPTGAGIN